MKDREAWHAVVHGVSKSRTQLSSWTTRVEHWPCPDPVLPILIFISFCCLVFLISIVWMKKVNLREPQGHTQVTIKRMWWGPDFHPGSLISELEPSAIICAAYGWHDKHEARNHILPIVPCATLWRMSGVDGVGVECLFRTTRLRRSRDADVHLMTQHSSRSQDECGHWGLLFCVDDRVCYLWSMKDHFASNSSPIKFDNA